MHSLNKFTISILLSSCAFSGINDKRNQKSIGKLKVENFQSREFSYKIISLSKKKDVQIGKTYLNYTHYPHIIKPILEQKFNHYKPISNLIISYVWDSHSEVYILTKRTHKENLFFEYTNKKYAPFDTQLNNKTYGLFSYLMENSREQARSEIDIYYSELNNIWFGYFPIGTFYIPRILPILPMGICTIERSFAYDLLSDKMKAFEQYLLCDYRLMDVSLFKLNNELISPIVINLQNKNTECIFILERTNHINSLYLLFIFSDYPQLKNRLNKDTCLLPRHCSHNLCRIVKTKDSYLAIFENLIYSTKVLQKFY